MTMPSWLKPGYQIAYARKEIAFARWKASGYRDLEQHARYLEHMATCNRYLAKAREVRSC